MNERAARTKAAEALVQARRQAGARVVISLYRLIKACQLYDTANDAVQQLVPPVVAAAAEYGRLFETDSARLLFSADQVFVNRRMMRGARETFALALQLGGWLDSCDLNEVTLDSSVEAASVLRLARLLVEAQRDRSLTRKVTEARIPGVSVRRAVGPEAQVERDSDESPVARVVKNYAASVLILRAFHGQLEGGSTRGANEVKRIAQKLVALSDGFMELLVSLGGGALPGEDPARAAVSTAVLALAMAKLLGADRGTLGTLAQAALLADAGVAWHGKQQPGQSATQTLGVLSLIGEYHLASIRRTVVAFEAQRDTFAQPPLALSSILCTARRFNELRAGQQDSSLNDVFERLDAESDRVREEYVRLLIRALGLVPPGTLVQLDSGELALVVAFPRAASDFARPPVELMTDRASKMLPAPLALDLAAPPPGRAPARIVRPVDLDQARIACAMTGRRR